jgi:hypothetical protein
MTHEEALAEAIKFTRKIGEGGWTSASIVAFAETSQAWTAIAREIRESRVVTGMLH